MGWCGYIILAPIYVFETGLPQPADLLILSVSGLSIALFLIKKQLVFNRVFLSLILMITLFAAINIAFGLTYGDSTFYFSSAYYIFNAMAFGATTIVFKDNPHKAWLFARWSFFIAIGLELAWIALFNSKTPWRETGSFNNPNQLGYWALLSAAAIVMLNYGRRMHIVDLGALMGCALMIAESLSRGAMISFVLILISLFIGKNISFMSKLGMVIVFLGFTLIQIFSISNALNTSASFSGLQSVSDRLDIFDSTSDPTKFNERGYERLIENPEYLITGSGEGAYWRFMEDATITGWSGLEIHSGLATILFSYGIFGFFLFCLFVFTIFQRAPWLSWFSLAAIMAYGLTHQHVRFTGLWIYLGIVYSMSRYVLPLYLAERKNES